MPKPKELGLSELIYRIKQDLLSEEARLRDPTTLYHIDEVSLEVNFVVTGDIDSGFSVGVVSLGSQVGEERVQKVIIKMTPLISKEETIWRLRQEGRLWRGVTEASMAATLKGRPLSEDNE